MGEIQLDAIADRFRSRTFEQECCELLGHKFGPHQKEIAGWRCRRCGVVQGDRAAAEAWLAKVEGRR